VSCTLGVERSEVLSRSRQRRLSLARALITWYATERGVATLAEVARRLERDPSTLFVGVERYRTLRPELFNLTALPDTGPLLRQAPQAPPVQPVVEETPRTGGPVLSGAWVTRR
jgi:putative transposase